MQKGEFNKLLQVDIVFELKIGLFCNGDWCQSNQPSPIFALAFVREREKKKEEKILLNGLRFLLDQREEKRGRISFYLKIINV